MTTNCSFQKVSRLISVIYTLSSSSELFSLQSHCKVLSEGHWASYFHQASLGTHLTYQFFSSATSKCKAGHLTVDQGSQLTSSTLKGSESCSLPRRSLCNFTSRTTGLSFTCSCMDALIAIEL
ncbi:hypothetical protein M5689_006610 [Euphorbia peplus]|nr:hypothetical protein M5689_006610 [Euphorbia peplus]